MARGEAIAQGVPQLQIDVPMDNNKVTVDVSAAVSAQLLVQLRAMGAAIIDSSEQYRSIRMAIAIDQVEAVAALPQIAFIQPKQ
jgi:hypothetical protein